MSGGAPIPIRPQAQTPLVLEPPTEQDGSVAVRTRLDITKIATEPALRKQRDLLLLAWEKLQYGNPDAGDPKTFFQIGGIHGWPYVPYNSDGKLDGPQTGYCWHGSQLFPNWHRPYVGLFEQELRRCAASIAAEYTGPDAADYVKAAEDLRLPYWNWLENNSQVPTIITDSEVTVNAPDGSHHLNPNPLSTFIFPIPPLGDGYKQLPDNLDAEYPPPATPRTRTVRQPKNGGIDTVNQDLAADFRTRTNNWRLMLLYRYKPNEYPFFADHSPPTPKPSINPVFATSLESVHDQVHVDVGGPKGQMMYPEVAGMDPIFWFHHCQVDRLLSQWQAAHPLCFVTNIDDKPDGGTYLTGDKPVATSPSYPLHPFRRDANGSFWTSEQARDTRSLGYTYDILNTLEAKHVEEATAAFAKITFEPIIDPKEAAPLAPVTPQQIETAHEKVHKAAVHFREKAAADVTFDDENDVRWTLVLPAVKRFQFNGSFTIYAFFFKTNGISSAEELAATPRLKETRADNPNYAGALAVFTITAARARHCENCQTLPDLISGTIDVTAALERIGLITADTPADAQLANWQDSLRLVAVDAKGRAHARVETGQPELHGIVAGGPDGLQHYNANDPPVSATATE